MDTQRMSQNITDVGNGWKRIAKHTVIREHRRGWRGQIDRLMAFVTHRPRRTVLADYSVSVYAKGDIDIVLHQPQLERHASHEH